MEYRELTTFTSRLLNRFTLAAEQSRRNALRALALTAIVIGFCLFAFAPPPVRRTWTARGTPEADEMPVAEPERDLMIGILSRKRARPVAPRDPRLGRPAQTCRAADPGRGTRTPARSRAQAHGSGVGGRCHRRADGRLGGWPAPFGITLVNDYLAAAMGRVTAVTAFTFTLTLAVAVYPLADIVAAAARAGDRTLRNLRIAGVVGACLADDLFNYCVWFKVMLIAAFGLLVRAVAAWPSTAGPNTSRS